MKRSSSFLWILQRCRRRFAALLLMLAAKIGVAVLGVFFALGSKNVINAAIGGSRQTFLTACIHQAVIIAGILLCLTISRHLHDKLHADLDRDWKQQLLHGLLEGEYVSVSQYHSGELINRMNNDVRTINEGLLNAIPNLLSMIAKMIGALLALFAMEPWLALILCACGSLMILVTGVLRRKLRSLFQKVSERDGKVSAFLQETLEKLLLVQAMDISKEMEKRSDIHLEERYVMQRKRKNISLFANTSVSVMTYGAGFVALIWSASKLMTGSMDFGSLTAVTQLVSQLQAPFTGVSAAFPQYVAMTASAERLMELEQLPKECQPMEADLQELYQRLDGIRGKALCFSYDREPVLKDADFCVSKGAFAVITGPSGIGKSTLLKLLLGIFHPESGQLSLDCGQTQIPVDRSTRKLFAYVPQGNLLFSGTLRENLMIVKPDATAQEIDRAVYISAMDEYLPQLPSGLDTTLGESGAGLSEGQAQRLAIARAVLSGAPILLLDESTSALDPETEQTVLNRIREMTNCTCIAVTHRPAAVELCDWQIEIDSNRVRVTPRRPGNP